MKRVLIIGARGSLASFVIDELQKQRDVHQTLFVRNKKRLAKEHLPKTSMVEGDVLNLQKTERFKAKPEIAGAVSRKSIAAFVASSRHSIQPCAI